MMLDDLMDQDVLCLCSAFLRISVSVDGFLTVSFIMLLKSGDYLRIPIFVVFFLSGQDWWWLTSGWRTLGLFQIWWWWYQIIMFWWFFGAVCVLKLCMTDKGGRRTVNFIATLDFTEELRLELIFLSPDSLFKFLLLSFLNFEYSIKKHSHHLFLLTGFIDNITELFVSLN